MDRENTYLEQLNESQREAVLYDGGPSLVVAGAGSGKTRVLTYKVAHLLQQGMPPYHILALTFTNKAAREMKNRIASLTGDNMAQHLWMGTFHSIFYRILRYEAEQIGYRSDFTIYDTSDSKSLIKSIIKEMQLDDKVYHPGMVQNRISNAKNALMTSRSYAQNREMIEHDQHVGIPLFREIYQRYQNRCFQAGAMDFDELLLQTNILFRDHPDVLAKYRDKFRYVLVDEYQDTNFAQHLIVTRLCELSRRIFVVGDDAQSIYSFRGANLDNMLRFKDQYPDCRIFKLEQNYRSTQNIVNAANSLIVNNKGQIPKTVFSENEPGQRINIYSSYSDYEEGYLVASRIMEMCMGENGNFSDFAILYRTNAQSRILEDALRKRNIAYKVYGSQSFYQRKEIKDIIAYCRVVVNPHDEEAMKRIINYPARGIGETTIKKILAATTQHQASIWVVLCDPHRYNVLLNDATVKKIEKFCNMIKTFIENNRMLSARDMAESIVRDSGMATVIVQDGTVEGLSRQENLQEFLKAVAEFCALRNEEGSNEVKLADFLMEVSLMTDQDNDKEENTDKVTLMTVHSAKGLEFNNVFIVGLEENLFPSQMALDSPMALEEERRLLYVAITRAMKYCAITYARSRFRNGKINACEPSRFLSDMDDRFLLWDEERANIRKRPDNLSVGWGAPSYRGLSPVPERKNPLIPLSDTYEKTEHKQVDSLDGLHTGDTVYHSRFGEGEITALEDIEGAGWAFVNFKHLGQKKLLLKYAKLTIVKKASV